MRSVTAALVAVAATLVTAMAGPAAAVAAPPPPAPPPPAPPPAAAGDLREEQLSIPTGDGLSLPATLRVPVDARPGLPGVVLVHGAGPGPREEYREEAEAFARAGIVTLAYDKRTVGYSLFERSYPLLAQDAVAAAALLRERPEVDPDAVGLWGLSEGGWVAPLAAASAPETAFVVVVGANGVYPLRQQVWADAVKMELAGVRGSLVDATSRTTYRLIDGMGGFAEAYYDPTPVLHRLTLPVLGIWGAKDRLTPPVESAAAYRAGLDRAGNGHYTLRTFADAEHSLLTTTDGLDKGAGFAPGYVELVGSWVADVAAGRTPPTSVAGTGEQPRDTVEVPPLAWYESPWVHAGALLVMVVGFVGFGVGAAWRRLGRRSPADLPVAARVLALAGLTAVLGGLGYLGTLMATRGRSVDPGPMLAGRPLVWLALQLVAVVAVVAGIVTVVTLRRGAGGSRARLGFLLTAGAVFVPWGLYWGLLLP